MAKKARLQKMEIGMVAAATALILIGVFSPAVKVPLYGTLSYFDLAGYESFFLMAAAVGALICMLIRLDRLVPLLALVVWGALLFPVLRPLFEQQNQGALSRLGRAVAKPFKSMATDVAGQIAGVSWGGIVLLAGCALVAFAAYKIVRK